MANDDLKARLMDIYEDVVSADEYGNDHNDRKDTREKFDRIIEQVKTLCDGECSNENSGLNIPVVSASICPECDNKFPDYMFKNKKYICYDCCTEWAK